MPNRSALMVTVAVLFAACDARGHPKGAPDSGPRPAITTKLVGERNDQELHRWILEMMRLDPGKLQPASPWNQTANGGHGFLEVFWQWRHPCTADIVPVVTRRGRTVRLAVTTTPHAGPPVEASPPGAAECDILTSFATTVRDLAPGRYRLVSPTLDLTVEVEAPR